MNSQSKKIIISALSHLDPELYIRIALSGGVSEGSALQKLATEMCQASSPEEEDAIESSIEDEVYYKSEITKWAHILALIALYHRVEIIRGRMLNVARNTKTNFHKVSDFSNALNAFGLTHNSLNDYPIIEELRYLVNNFKHNGTKAGEKLSTNYPKYSVASEISIQLTDVFMFAEKSESYIKEMSEMIKSKIA